MSFRGFVFGIPKEILSGERRVAATPETVKKMVVNGAQVLVEKNAGTGSFFTDDAYRAAGAKIIENAEMLYASSQVILKVKEPHFNEAAGKSEVAMMNESLYLISFLHPASPANHGMVRELAERGIVSLTLDSIPRIARAQSMDALSSMSTVAGYKGMLLAANELPQFVPMMGLASGMTQPGTALIVGTGVAGLQSIATGKRLGAIVYAADIRKEACEQAKSLGAKIVDLDIPQQHSVGAGGYARKLPDEWLVKERDILKNHVAQADIIILSALIPGKQAPILITADMVRQMKPGSVILDIAIDQGGNCELTKAGETIETSGVKIFGIQNIPGSVPKSATSMFALNIFNFISYLIKDEKCDPDVSDEIIGPCIVTKNGEIVHAGARESMNL